MVWAILPRVVLRRLAVQPVTWFALGLATILVPLLARTSPTLELEGGELVGRLFRGWSSLTRLVGTLAALAILAQLAPLRRWLPPRARLVGEAAGLFLGALAATLPLFVGAVLALPTGTCLPPAELLGQVAACLHLAALGTLTLRVPVSPRLHVLGLAALAWLLPAFLPAGLAQGLAPLLDPSATERAFSTFGLASRAPFLSFTLVASLLLAATLAVRGPGGPPQHEVRRPR